MDYMNGLIKKLEEQMIPKKTLGASNIDLPKPAFKGPYHKMVEQVDQEHQEKLREQEEYVEKVSEANRDPATILSSHEEQKIERRKARKSLRSAQHAESDNHERIFIDDPGVLTDYNPHANLVTPQGYDDLVQRVEDELFKMRRVLTSKDNQQWILDNWTFLVHMLVKIVHNYYSPDKNVPPKAA